MEDAKVLDLFAGSGALAIEALSRNAKYAVINDMDKEAITTINENINKTRLQDKVKITQLDYKRLLSKLQGEKFDIIFIDPPYAKDMKVEAIKKISEYELLKTDGIIVLETDNKENIPEILGEYKMYDQRKYGRVKLCLFAGKG